MTTAIAPNRSPAPAWLGMDPEQVRLHVAKQLPGFDDGELAEIARTAQTIGAEFALIYGDVVCYKRDAGGGNRLAKSRRLQAWCQAHGLDHRDAVEHAAVAEMFTPERRRSYPSLSWRCLRELTRQTSDFGDTNAARTEAVLTLAAEAEDRGFGVSGVLRLIEERRPGTNDAIEEPVPAPFIAPPLNGPAQLETLAAVVDTSRMEPGDEALFVFWDGICLFFLTTYGFSVDDCSRMAEQMRERLRRVLAGYVVTRKETP